MNSIPSLHRLLLAAGLVVLGAAASATAKEYRFDFRDRIETGEKIEIDVDYEFGDIRIIGTDDYRLEIDAVKTVEAVSMEEARKVADRIRIRVQQSDTSFRISTAYRPVDEENRSLIKKIFGVGETNVYGTVDFVLHVPRHCEIIVKNRAGNMEVSNTLGAVKLTANEGNIDLSGIEGDIDVDNFAGRTTGSLLFGEVTVQQPKGDIDLKWIEGDVRIKSTSAAINLQQERGAIDLVTSTGDVTIQTNLYSSREFFIETQSGDVRLQLPEFSSGRLNISSETGNIKTDLPMAIESITRKKVVGAFGSGGVSITIASTSGDVSIAQF